MHFFVQRLYFVIKVHTLSLMQHCVDCETLQMAETPSQTLFCLHSCSSTTWARQFHSLCLCTQMVLGNLQHVKKITRYALALMNRNVSQKSSHAAVVWSLRGALYRLALSGSQVAEHLRSPADLDGVHLALGGGWGASGWKMWDSVRVEPLD